MREVSQRRGAIFPKIFLGGFMTGLHKALWIYRACIVLAVAFALLAIWAHPARGHQAASGWTYPIECCSDRDCYLIESKYVHETQEGWDIAPSEGGGFVPRGKERQSPDGAYHLCRSVTSGAILCFFAPAMGS
jgi:hypothetical protein